MRLIVDTLYSTGVVQAFWASAQSVPSFDAGECFAEKCFLEPRPLWKNMVYRAEERTSLVWLKASSGLFQGLQASSRGGWWFWHILDLLMYQWSQQNNARECIFQCTVIGKINTRNIAQCKMWSSKHSHSTYRNYILLILCEIHWSRKLSVPWLKAEHKKGDQVSACLLIWNAGTWAELQEDLSWGQEQLTNASALSKGSDSADL